MGKDVLLKTVIGGIVALVVVMGIGRFAFTPILPIMKNAQLFTERGAGYLASANYFGYFIGALSASILQWRRGKTFYLTIYLMVNIATTIWMGFSDNLIVWFVLRCISGFSSGLVFVLASSIVMDTLSFYKRMTWAGIFYSGVGIGIFLSGLLVPQFEDYFHWQGAWIGMGVIASVLGIIAILFLKEHPAIHLSEKLSTMEKSQRIQIKSQLRWLIASYGCEGVGYIVSATFLVALVQKIPSLSEFPSISWVFVGLAATPSCFIWSLIAKRWGNLPTLQVAYLLQVIGVLLPVFLFNTTGALLGALLFGATFMGITTLFVAEARNIAPFQSNQVIGYLTFVYGVGQMIGPSVAGVLMEKTGNYNTALFFAASMLVFGMAFLGVAQYKTLLEKNLNKKYEKRMG